MSCKTTLFKSPCCGQGCHPAAQLPRAPSNLALSASRDGAPQLLWAAVPASLSPPRTTDAPRIWEYLWGSAGPVGNPQPLWSWHTGKCPWENELRAGLSQSEQPQRSACRPQAMCALPQSLTPGLSLTCRGLGRGRGWGSYHLVSRLNVLVPLWLTGSDGSW